MEKLYTLVALKEREGPVICYDTPEHEPEGIPVCSKVLGEVEAQQGALARQFPGVEYIVCELVPVNYDLPPEKR